MAYESHKPIFFLFVRMCFFFLLSVYKTCNMHTDARNIQNYVTVVVAVTVFQAREEKKVVCVDWTRFSTVLCHVYVAHRPAIVILYFFFLFVFLSGVVCVCFNLCPLFRAHIIHFMYTFQLPFVHIPLLSLGPSLHFSLSPLPSPSLASMSMFHYSFGSFAQTSSKYKVFFSLISHIIDKS